jgi:hypothetical protein
MSVALKGRRLKISRVTVLDNFQVYPGLTSWAKFSRDYAA